MNDSCKLIRKLQNWYLAECDGDWEHSFGISIETLDNPGWLVTIDLLDTLWETTECARSLMERSEDDWIQVEVTKGKFIASGGPKNLEEIVTEFFRLIEAINK